MSPAFIGFTIGIPLAFILGVYAVQRGKALASYFQESNERLAKIPEKGLYYSIIACSVGAAFLFGAIAGQVYSFVGTPTYYYLAFGSAFLLSLLAWLIKTPLKGDKILWNMAIGSWLGLLVPVLIG
jgi:uncharacterized membrane protein